MYLTEKLTSGCYSGTVVRSWQSETIILTETDYASGMHVPKHCHENCYICLIRQGGYSETYEHRRRECEPAWVVVHPAGEAHSETNHTAVRSFNIEFRPTALEANPNLKRVAARPFEFAGGRVSWLALALYRDFRWERSSSLAWEALVWELVDAITGASDSRFSLSAPAWLARIRDALHEEEDGRWSLYRLAELAGVHPVHLATVFRKCHGCSIGLYQRRLRVERACRRILKSNQPLVEIALDCGFSDQSHFCRVFRRITGFTPGEYRVLTSRARPTT